MWDNKFYYEDIKFLEPDRNPASRQKTEQELLFFNILLPELVKIRPTKVCKSESPDFIVHPTCDERLYVEVVTAVAVAHENDVVEEQGINQEKRWAEIRNGDRINKSYTTNSEELAQIVAREIKKKRCLARKWPKNRPIILLVGLVGVSGLPLDLNLQKYVKNIDPFSNIIVGEGTVNYVL
ncbi:hypothetical protein [Acidithiobacillus thiooxidans]|uniref:hypothetical protein n=1 Tax=Acidithiobacillus thiooxidans TaxID=930 RepID=UPI0009DAB080|nr:hypothetical protein [Acidithiobacillus thiooxidans]